tara:strand:+ start:18454 stop:18960 length:507 start_codon:yes stop_codon:yes gene_type:complete
MIKKLTIAFMLLTTSLFAEEFSLAGKKIELPLPKSWQAKTPQENSLVFFDTTKNEPRLVISVYLAPFKYPGKDVSEFEEEYLKNKKEWLLSVNAGAKEKPDFSYQESELSVTISYLFDFNAQSFKEIVKFQDCKDGSAIALKAMIPQGQTALENKATIDQFFKATPCP